LIIAGQGTPAFGRQVRINPAGELAGLVVVFDDLVDEIR
jgi:hypothetical protein